MKASTEEQSAAWLCQAAIDFPFRVFPICLSLFSGPGTKAISIAATNQARNIIEKHLKILVVVI